MSKKITVSTTIDDYRVSVSVDCSQYAWLEGHAKAAGVTLAEYCRRQVLKGHAKATGRQELEGHAKDAGMSLTNYCRFKLLADYDAKEQERVLKEVVAVFEARKANEQEDTLTRIKRNDVIKYAAKVGVLRNVVNYYQ